MGSWGHAGAQPAPSRLARSLQTILVGDSGVGKTSLLVQFDQGKFIPGSFSATVGIGFTVRAGSSGLGNPAGGSGGDLGCSEPGSAARCWGWRRRHAETPRRGRAHAQPPHRSWGVSFSSQRGSCLGKTQADGGDAGKNPGLPSRAICRAATGLAAAPERVPLDGEPGSETQVWDLAHSKASPTQRVRSLVQAKKEGNCGAGGAEEAQPPSPPSPAPGYFIFPTPRGSAGRRRWAGLLPLAPSSPPMQ